MKAWECKIGWADGSTLPEGADLPMRTAVATAYRQLTGTEPGFIFSGWGAVLTDLEREEIAK
jgi:hypothetical protein